MNDRKLTCTVIAIFLLAISITGCAGKATEPAPADSIFPTQTSTAQPLVDAFFSGYAFLDMNGNGEIDSEDTPIENATFIVTLHGGMEVGDMTDENGNAFITIPGGVEYPVTLRMEPGAQKGHPLHS